MNTTPKWVENLWKWADENEIPSYILPREFEELIEETSIYFIDYNFPTCKGICIGPVNA